MRGSICRQTVKEMPQYIHERTMGVGVVRSERRASKAARHLQPVAFIKAALPW
jgi:hypothetical protein